MNKTPQESGEIYTVSSLNREVRALLEGSFATFWIEGELSNFAAPHSGHWYFSLKDATAQVKCAMFRPQNRHHTVVPRDGMQVLLKARVSLYEGRGDFQLIIEHLEEAGEGKLRKAFEALKKRLLDAGLFNQAHKKSLPNMPQCIGVITSPTGAAIQDILTILKRRFSCVPIIIYPTLVQGEIAAARIVQAIQTANHRKDCDILILARGGGSLEDLWPFNEESVAQAIYKSDIPIVTGIGHEVDFTIADFTADLRAPTPSAAAELITPDQTDLLHLLNQRQQHLIRLMLQNLQQRQHNLTWLNKHLQQQHPKRRLRERSQQLDLLEMELVRLQTRFISHYQIKLHQLQTKFQSQNPLNSIQELQHQLKRQWAFLRNNHVSQVIHQKQQTLATFAAKLDALSPLATLKRGYAIVTNCTNHHVVQNSNEVTIGEKVNLRLNKGELLCTINKID